MAAPVIFTCPECKKQMKGRADLEGKKVRCKSCSHAFVARAADEPSPSPAPAKAGKAKPAKAASAPAPAAPPKPIDDDDDEGPKSYGLTDTSLTPRCPECANELDPPDAIICLHCGYNTVTRQRASFRKVHETTTGEQFLWLLPGILCVILDLIIIGFDAWYIFKIEEVVDTETFIGKFLAHGACKLWLVIISLFAMYHSTRFAIRRLIINYKPPEVEKH